MKNWFCLSLNLRVLKIYWLDQTYRMYWINSAYSVRKISNNSDSNQRTPESGAMAGVFPACNMKRGKWGQRCLFMIISLVISWFINTELKQIYCSYSRSEKIRRAFYNFCYFFEVTAVAKLKQALIGNNFLLFISFHCSQLYHCAPCPTAALASLLKSKCLWIEDCELTAWDGESSKQVRAQSANASISVNSFLYKTLSVSRTFVFQTQLLRLKREKLGHTQSI